MTDSDVRAEVDEAMRRNAERRRWYLDFKAKWLLEKGIIEVRGRDEKRE